MYDEDTDIDHVDWDTFDYPDNDSEQLTRQFNFNQPHIVRCGVFLLPNFWRVFYYHG